MRLSNLLIIASHVVLSFCTTVSIILDDIGDINDDLTTANDAITALATTITLATALQLLAILSSNSALVATLDRTTADTLALSPSPVSDADGRDILDALEDLEPIINDSATKLIERKAVIADFPTIPLVGNPLALAKAALVTLKTSLNALEDAAERAAPPGLLDEGNALRDRINNQLKSVITAFNS